MPQALIEIEEHMDGVALLRNSEIMLTPKRKPLIAPSYALAEALMAELTPLSGAPGNEAARPRPLTKLVYTTLDQVEDAREIIIESMLAYLHTDTICYLAEDPELQQFERKYWQPIIDWTQDYFSVELETFEGVMPADQSEETAERLADHLRSYSNWQLTALMDLTTGLSSLLLALAVMEGRLTSLQALECANADELHQNQKWGVDEEVEKRRARLRGELAATEQFLALL